MRQFVPTVYDPPEGWRFGFPKQWPQHLLHTQENLASQLRVDGYPEGDIPLALLHTRFIGEYTTISYEQWMSEVDRVLETEIGLTQADLPDWLSRDAYEAEMTPEQAAHECLRQVRWEPEEGEVVDEW